MASGLARRRLLVGVAGGKHAFQFGPFSQEGHRLGRCSLRMSSATASCANRLTAALRRAALSGTPALSAVWIPWDIIVIVLLSLRDQLLEGLTFVLG